MKQWFLKIFCRVINDSKWHDFIDFTDTEFFVTFVQIWSSLQTEFLLSLTLLIFPVSILFSLIIGFIFWFLKMNFGKLLSCFELFDVFTDTPQNERVDKREEIMWYHIVFISSELDFQILQYQLLLLYSCGVWLRLTPLEFNSVKLREALADFSNHKIGPLYFEYAPSHTRSPDARYWRTQAIPDWIISIGNSLTCVLSSFAVYAVEAALKLIGLGFRKYFQSGWNVWVVCSSGLK